jgi:diphosphomevalonate decarboxylase
MSCLHAVEALRRSGTGAWATMDAGPNVKVLCLPEDSHLVSEALLPHAERVEVLGPGVDARLEATP